MCNDEGTAAMVAYVQGNKPNASINRWYKSPGGSKTKKSTGAGKPEDGPKSGRTGMRPKLKGGERQRVHTEECSGQCCVSDKVLLCGDVDHDKCECECGQHRHFMSAGDRDAALLVLSAAKKKT